MGPLTIFDWEKGTCNPGLLTYHVSGAGRAKEWAAPTELQKPMRVKMPLLQMGAPYRGRAGATGTAVQPMTWQTPGLLCTYGYIVRDALSRSLPPRPLRILNRTPPERAIDVRSGEGNLQPRTARRLHYLTAPLPGSRTSPAPAPGTPARCRSAGVPWPRPEAPSATR